MIKSAEPITPARRSAVDPLVRDALWAFYNSNPDRVVVKVGGFIKIRVRDLRLLFEAIAGPE